MRKKRVALLFLVIIIILSTIEGVFAHISVSAVGLQLQAANTTIDTNMGCWQAGPNINEDYWTSIHMEWALQPQDYWGFIYYQYDASGNPEELGREIIKTNSSTGLDEDDDWFTPPSSYSGGHVDGVALYLHSGAYSGNRYAAFMYGVNSEGSPDNDLSFASYNHLPVTLGSESGGGGGSSGSGTTANGNSVLNLIIDWFDPDLPSGQNAPNVIPVSPDMPGVNSSVDSLDSPGSLTHSDPDSIGELDKHIVTDTGGNSENVTVPSYSVPERIDSPGPLPDSLDPNNLSTTPKEQALPRNEPMNIQEPVERNNPLTIDGIMERENAMERSSPMDVQQWERQTWICEPVLGQ